MSRAEVDADRFQRACAGKDRHASEAAALAVAALQRTAMRAYRCRFCGFWHLATTPGATKRPTSRPPSFERLRHRRGNFQPHPRRPVAVAEGTVPELPPVVCDGGPGYASEIEAIRGARESGATVGRKLAAYACTCGLWHLGRRTNGRPR